MNVLKTMKDGLMMMGALGLFGLTLCLQANVSPLEIFKFDRLEVVEATNSWEECAIPDEEQLKYNQLVANITEHEGRIQYEFVDKLIIVKPDGTVLERQGNSMTRSNAMDIMENVFGDHQDLLVVDENGNYQINSSKELTEEAKQILENTQQYLIQIKNAQFAQAN